MSFIFYLKEKNLQIYILGEKIKKKISKVKINKEQKKKNYHWLMVLPSLIKGLLCWLNRLMTIQVIVESLVRFPTRSYIMLQGFYPGVS